MGDVFAYQYLNLQLFFVGFSFSKDSQDFKTELEKAPVGAF